MKKIINYSLIFLILTIWQICSYLELVSKFLLPSPYEIVLTFIHDFKLIMYHTSSTMKVAFIGIFLGIILSIFLSLIMDKFKVLYDLIYPVLILTQTIPTIAIAPLLIIWLGYYMAPKIILVVLATFFPITISLINGYKSVDKDNINLLKAMGANEYQIYKYLKIPSSMPFFFSGLKVSMSYALISAVIAEWLGGYYGLGVYMTRVRKAYALDKMFAIIFFISILSLLLMLLVDILEKKIIKY
ncbi:MAG: ABC transporter permease [Oceanivirga sp.]|nr:ABC transporter permease [Oceanivirga sp.]